jgi:hypothetical protein
LQQKQLLLLLLLLLLLATGRGLSAAESAAVQPLLSATSSHLAAMAGAGYRTLVVAGKRGQGGRGGDTGRGRWVRTGPGGGGSHLAAMAGTGYRTLVVAGGQGQERGVAELRLLSCIPPIYPSQLCQVVLPVVFVNCAACTAQPRTSMPPGLPATWLPSHMPLIHPCRS